MKKIFVGNFLFSTTEADLRQWFHLHGPVESVTIVTDRDTGRSRGFGFVQMVNDSEADAAIAALNGSDAGGRSLTVNGARAKVDRGNESRGGWGGARDDNRGDIPRPRRSDSDRGIQEPENSMDTGMDVALGIEDESWDRRHPWSSTTELACSPTHHRETDQEGNL